MSRGDLETRDRLFCGLANRARCIVVSVVYRLASENPYSAGYDDAWAALMCVGWSTLPKLDTTGSDSRSGDSAGDVLTACVAQKAANDGPTLRLLVLLNPNLDATTSRPRAALRKAFEQNLCIGTFGGRGFKRFACYAISESESHNEDCIVPLPYPKRLLANYTKANAGIEVYCVLICLLDFEK